jgi:hypothetical protein
VALPSKIAEVKQNASKRAVIQGKRNKIKSEFSEIQNVQRGI